MGRAWHNMGRAWHDWFPEPPSDIPIPPPKYDEITGDVDRFQLLCKVSERHGRWMKSTKAYEVPNGCIVQVSTSKGDNVTEAVCFVPGVKIVKDINDGKKLVAVNDSEKSIEPSKAYEVPGGCIVQVTTSNGEAVCFVPNVKTVKDTDKLVATNS